MKFSIITPAFNMEKWIARTIETVLSQRGDFSIEYIIVDNASKDTTERIANEYAEKIKNKTYPIKCNDITMRVVTQKKPGMYEAINNGFELATGDVYAWINADDTYKQGAFQAMATAFATFPEIQWIKGITDTNNESWQTTRTGSCRVYRQDWIQKGIYGQEAYFIEQDSCFWRASLWKRGGPIPKEYRSAGDYWLWISFAQYAPLWSLNVSISSFMKREGQISKNISKYKSEQKHARSHCPISALPMRIFFSFWSRLGSPKDKIIFNTLYSLLFMSKPFAYIAIENKTAVKKTARSFIITS